MSTTHINMEPQVVLLTDVSDLIDGVKCAVHCRTSCGIHKQWHITLQNQHTWPSDEEMFRVRTKDETKTVTVTLTFCLASMILASRSAGMTLPLKEHHVIQVIHSILHIYCMNCGFTSLRWILTSHLCSVGSHSQHQSPEQLQPSLWSSGSVGKHIRYIIHRSLKQKLNTSGEWRFGELSLWAKCYLSFGLLSVMLSTVQCFIDKSRCDKSKRNPLN